MEEKVDRIMAIYKEMRRDDHPSRSSIVGMGNERPGDVDTLLDRLEVELTLHRHAEEERMRKLREEPCDVPRQAKLPSGEHNSGGGTRVIKKADGL